MENVLPFFDLRVNENIKKSFVNFAQKYVEFGYKTIAIDHLVDLTGVESKEKKAKKKIAEHNIIPEPTDIKQLLKQTGCEDLGLTILNRITIIAKDKDSLMNAIKSDTFNKYHIFAIIPKSPEIIQFAGEILEVDIISFDPLDSKGAHIKLKSYNKIISRGIHFEITYYPAIADSTLRRNTIATSHRYHQVGKSKNIIITSGCNQYVLNARNPYDVINLGIVFGLSHSEAKYAITTASANVIKHAISRKVGKATVFIVDAFKEENMELEDSTDDEKMEPIQKKIKT